MVCIRENPIGKFWKRRTTSFFGILNKLLVLKQINKNLFFTNGYMLLLILIIEGILGRFLYYFYNTIPFLGSSKTWLMLI